MTKRNGKHWKTRKEEFNEVVSTFQHLDRKNPEIVNHFIHGDYHYHENRMACALVSTVTFLILFFLLRVLDYCLKFIGIYWIINALIEAAVGIIFCCVTFYVNFGKKTEKRHNELNLNRIDRIQWFWLTILGILMFVYTLTK